MLQAFIAPIASLIGTFVEGRVAKTKAKAEARVVKAKAEADAMRVAATHEAGWETIMARASDNSWKDEAWTLLFIAVIVATFIPPLQPYVERGLAALDKTPAWYQYAMYASIAASFGLRSIKGFKK